MKRKWKTRVLFSCSRFLIPQTRSLEQAILSYDTLKVVFSLDPNEYRIQPAVTETIGLIPFVSSKKQEAYSDRAPSSSWGASWGGLY